MAEEPDLINRLVTDKSLARLARGYVVDLWVYDDHFATAKLIKVRRLLSVTTVFSTVMVTVLFKVWQQLMIIPLCSISKSFCLLRL